MGVSGKNAASFLVACWRLGVKSGPYVTPSIDILTATGFQQICQSSLVAVQVQFLCLQPLIVEDLAGTDQAQASETLFHL
jgi:hypothetical protein